ncbi:hypothetical protein, partial [uncultured Parabacteroides sp.]|uniref:hypothetical protein n=1 Tax=uncultured Parabacteroides sp. TaxID=512312 RepID=UPI00272B0A8B
DTDCSLVYKIAGFFLWYGLYLGFKVFLYDFFIYQASYPNLNIFDFEQEARLSINIICIILYDT